MELKEVRHHLKFYRTSLVINLSREMQYRLDFWLGLLSTASWTALSLVFLSAIYSKVPSIVGWKLPELLMVLGLYRFLEGVGEFFFNRSFKRFSEDIRKGRLDLLLVKPIDLQFYLSLRYTQFESLSSTVAGAAIFFYGLSQGEYRPSIMELGLFFLLASLGFIFYYTLWFSISLLNFWLVKVDNLRHLVHGLVGISRFPPEAYGRRAEVFLSFVVPLALIVAFPVKTLLHRAEWWYLPFSLVVSLFLFFLARRFFYFALRSYTGAGG